MLKLKSTVDKSLSAILVVLMSALVIDVLWQVFSRYVLNDPSSFTEELARFLLIWVGLLGASYAAGKRMHLAVDILPNNLEGRRKSYLMIFILACTFFAPFLLKDAHKMRWVWAPGRPGPQMKPYKKGFT